MVKLPLLCFVVMAIAAFAPPPIRGIVILICCGIALWYTCVFYTPHEPTPDLPEQPDPKVEAASDLIAEYGVEKAKIRKIEK